MESHGANARALDHHEAALASSGFVMARVMKAWLLLLGCDVRRVCPARTVLYDAVRLQPASGLLRHERLHPAAVLDDN